NQKLKNPIKQTDNAAESKNVSGKHSDSGTINRTAQNKADILTKETNAEIPLGKMEKSDSPKQIKTDKVLEKSAVSQNEKAAGAIAASKTSSAEKLDSQGIKSNFTLKNELKAADFVNVKNISPTGDPTGQTAQKDLQPKQNIKTNFIKAPLTSDIAGSSLEKNHKMGENVKKVKNTTILKTPAAKTDIVDSSGKTGVLELNTADTSEANIEKASLSRSQTDLLVSKMIQQIKTAPSSLEVSLKPEYLGKISILLQSKEGQISVNFIAQKGDAMDLLKNNLPSIKDNLEQQGIKLQQMEVNVANQQKQDSQTGSRYRDGTRQHQPFAAISQKHGYTESSEEFSLMPYKLNLLA
ncbi:MAG TPA: flagellar hook-length control protein FliK, partial [Syntrophomonadaceae bacterium]|nr:flagellar hook-length control protein FliK [Syntrophomonadaceae bacterium]